MEQIIANGRVIRGWIGVEVQDITPELADSFHLPGTKGALIAGVLTSGPADRAGVKPGDVLLDVEGKPVTDSQDMLNQVAALTPGKLATITVLRNKTNVTLHLTVGTRPKIEQPQMDDLQDDGGDQDTPN